MTIIRYQINSLRFAVKKLGFYYTVVDAMLKAGFTKEEIGKIGGGNFCRIFDVVTKGHN